MRQLRGIEHARRRRAPRSISANPTTVLSPNGHIEPLQARRRHDRAAAEDQRSRQP